MTNAVQNAQRIEITDDDLPLHCPTPQTPVWCYHPRVFLPVNQGGEVKCPYCSTVYVYRGKASTRH